jgi:hypothetical protein
MSARPDPFRVHVADQVLAALAEAGTPMSTPALQVATGYSPRYGQLVYNTLTRLAREGLVEKVTIGAVKPVFWRRLAPVIAMPPMDVISDQDRRRKP